MIDITPALLDAASGRQRPGPAVLLIHELGHALHGHGHGPDFRAELRRASDFARSFCNLELAEALLAEALMYDPDVPIEEGGAGDVDDVGLIHGQVRDLVNECGSTPLEQVYRHLALTFGLTSEELRQRFPGIPEVYEAEMKMVQLQIRCGAQALAAFKLDQTG